MRFVKLVTRNSKETAWHIAYILVLSLIFPCIEFNFTFGIVLFTLLALFLIYAIVTWLFLYFVITLFEFFL